VRVARTHVRGAHGCGRLRKVSPGSAKVRSKATADTRARRRASFRQLTTAFSAKNGNIEAEGEWSLGGAFGFGYANGSFGLQKPQLAATSTIVDSIQGISMGVNGIVVVYQARFHVGIGAFGFNTGLTASAGLTIGSAAGSPIKLCRSAHVGVWLNYGVGYSMPAAVQQVINFFLRLFDAKPIERQGGIGSTENVVNSYTLVPDSPICRG
jgi:hypothetical protein